MSVTVDGLTDAEAEDAIQTALAAELNVHPSAVEVSYDSETGIVTYTISGDDAESIAKAVSDMEQDGFEESITAVDGIEVDDFVAPTDIIVTVDVVVDASNVDDAETVVSSVTDAIQSQDSSYDIIGEGRFYVMFDFLVLLMS